MSMNDATIKMLEAEGWTVECESPLEMRHIDGSFATGQAAEHVLYEHRQPMGDDDYQLTQDMIMNLARQVQLLDISAFLARLNHAETAAPFTDPTLYREVLYSGKLEAIKRIAEGAQKFLSAVNDVKKMALEGKIKE